LTANVQIDSAIVVEIVRQGSAGETVTSSVASRQLSQEINPFFDRIKPFQYDGSFAHDEQFMKPIALEVDGARITSLF
tara:strand:- start:429 stop:662 length:234 start_codon:yes stop_codon:yes gene_type:complete